MTKQDVIKSAYGANWDKVKDIVDPYGWMPFKKKFDSYGYDMPDVDVRQGNAINEFYWRPTALNGLENNNGWVIATPELIESLRWDRKYDAFYRVFNCAPSPTKNELSWDLSKEDLQGDWGIKAGLTHIRVSQQDFPHYDND